MGHVSRRSIPPGFSVHTPEYAVPPPTGQQYLPGELPRALLVPAVDALAVTEQAVAGAVARAVSAVSELPRLRHIPLHWKCGRGRTCAASALEHKPVAPEGPGL